MIIKHLISDIVYHALFRIILLVLSASFLLISVNVLGYVFHKKLMKNSGTTMLTMLDIGQGDSFLIETKAGHKILVDTGNELSKFNTALSSPEDSLGINIFKYERKTFDLVIISHDHDDHVGILKDIAQEYRIGAIVSSPLKHAYIDKVFSNSNLITNTRSVETRNDTDRKSTKSINQNLLTDRLPIGINGASIEIGEESIHFHYPYLSQLKQKLKTRKQSENEDSSIFTFSSPRDNFAGSHHKNASSKINIKQDQDSGDLVEEELRTNILFTGDAGITEEKQILNSLHRIDILKIGHHGSKTSTSLALLEKINAHIALMSLGEKNRYGHPHKQVLKNLYRHMDKGNILRTDRCGQQVLYIYKSGAIGHRTCEITNSSEIVE